MNTALFWLGLLMAGAGFASYRMWGALPWGRAGEYAALAAAAVILALVLSRMGRIAFASAAAGLFGIALAWFAGIVPVLATGLLGLAAVGLGTLVVRPGCAGRLPLSLVVGLALVAATVGWLLPLPVHGWIVYLMALLAIVAIRHVAIRETLAALATDWREAVRGAPWHASFAVVVLGLASTACWLPTMQYDDLAYHLALPWQLQTLGYYRLDAASNVWALAPWSADVLQGVVQVVAGQEGRGALSALWLCVIASLSWQLGAAIGLGPRLRWLAAALYFTHPVSSALLNTMQAETAATAGMLALALVIQRAPRTAQSRDLRLVAVLAAFLLALKASLVLVLLPMAVWWLWTWWGRIAWKGLPWAIAAAVFVGGSSYAYAIYISGNPLLPLFNEVFHSQYMDPGKMHLPWMTGFSLTLPWRMVFETHAYLESLDGAAGFTLIALAGALVVSLTDAKARPLALVGIACLLLPLTQIQYLRYAQPALALLGPAMLAGAAIVFGRGADDKAMPGNRVPQADAPRTDVMQTGVLQTGISSSPMLSTIVIVLCALNIAFFANAKWNLSSGALRLLVTKGSDDVIARYAPERVINHYLREQQPSHFLALYPAPASAFAAELGGRGLVTNWYDRQLKQLRPLCDADPSGDKWRQLFVLTGATHVVVRQGAITAPLQAALTANGAKLIKTAGPMELWQLTVNGPESRFMQRRNIAKRILP